MNLKNQRRMAAELLKCGVHRVWIDPNKMEDLEDAITRSDIRTAIASKTIVKLPKKGISSARKKYIRAQKEKGRRGGHGKRKGAQRARMSKKRAWIHVIRPIREQLREYKEAGKISPTTYRKLYMQAKGGMFKNRAHLEQQLRMAGYLKEETE